MQQAFYELKYSDGKFWEMCQDEMGEYEQEVFTFAHFDNIADGALWSMSVRGHKQRKHHARSGMTKSILAMLDTAKAELAKDRCASVLCLTPNVIVEFFAA